MRQEFIITMTPLGKESGLSSVESVILDVGDKYEISKGSLMFTSGVRSGKINIVVYAPGIWALVTSTRLED